MAGSSEKLFAVSHQMGVGAEETSAQANVVAAAADQVTRNLQTVAAATEEMTASIGEISKNASAAAGVAARAVAKARQANVTMDHLGVSSAEIGEVVKVINSIAQQTKLLALNATIEAARAGAAGKGFAVVANEVKELANETARATQQISEKINAIRTGTDGAVIAIAEIGDIIAQMHDISTTIASAVEEQTATTREIARNVSEAAIGESHVTENITSVAQAAENTSGGAHSTQTAAGELAGMAAELQKVVGVFKYARGRELDGDRSGLMAAEHVTGGGGMHALIVDDSTTMRLILKAHLQKLGFAVTEAINGRDALVKLHAMGKADVVLVDWNMPEMDGLDFVKAVRAEIGYAALPLMMVTTNSEREHVERALEAGANEYVMKPFTGAMIREKLEMLGFVAA